MSAAASGILEDFIASEDQALVQCKQGDFYPPNNHLIKTLVSSAPEHLDDLARQRLYFHLLRVGELPVVNCAHEFGLLAAAYAEMVPLLSDGFPACSLQRSLGLLAFGYDDHGALPGEPPADADSFRHHARVWAQCNAYSAIPYILRAKDEFALYAEDAALAHRVHKLLRHTQYVHSEVNPAEGRYPITRLWFWALVFLALLNAETAPGVVEDFLHPQAKLPRYREQLNILERYLEVAEPDLRTRVAKAASALPS